MVRVTRLIVSFTLLVFLFAGVWFLYTSCSPAPAGNQTDSMTQQQQTITISGKIINYVSSWKPFATKDNVNFIYGTVASSGEPRDYSVKVPINWGIATVGIYKDDNNNGYVDPGESKITKQITIGTANLTVGFEVVPILTVSGTLTGYPLPQWKVVAIVGTQYYIYGVVNTSTYSYTINIASNTYVYKIIAFKDNNNNAQYDFGEAFVESSLNSFYITNNVTQDINIPNLQTMTLKVGISNNIYGLRIGVYAFSSTGSYVEKTPTNLINYEHTIQIDGFPGGNVTIGLYYDINNNNSLDKTNTLYSPIPLNLEGTLEVTNVFFDAVTVNVPVNLVPHTITGKVEYINGASGFKPAVSAVSSQSLFSLYLLSIGSVAGSSYVVRFYTVTNMTNTDIVVSMFKDINNNSLKDLSEPAVEWYSTGFFGGSSSNITIDPETPSTNTANFHILRTLINLSLVGTDANQFKFLDLEYFISLLAGNVYQGINLPLNNYELYIDTNTNFNFFIIIAKDDNNNGILELQGFSGSSEYDTTGFYHVIISNQTTVNLNYNLVKATITNVINGTPNSSYNPFLFGCGLFGDTGQGYICSTRKVEANTVVINLYSTKTLTGGIFSCKLVDDNNINGGDFSDFSIATNTVNGTGEYSLLFVGSDVFTNVTWYYTN
ncbi:MAG: hypothetical protein N2712_00070 [Brevinematales bacterium]|nr:hypothetical protein [Brevinematales bacterium]